jgi:uncharacterized protein (TIGR03503 family)
MTLLDNRFRVDPTINQITFLIYRSNPSKPVVLVRPDGVKYYAWRHPDTVKWYQEPSMDIISIDSPMPGPWQAVGKVTPANNIKIISHLELKTDTLPSRLYHGEDLKFSAQLVSDNKPLLLRDFLDRIHLKVTFTKYLENEEQITEEAQPQPEIVGEFADDGRMLDEYPGDGIFTVKLNITPEPGKYRVRITSGNGVFLRAQEQVVLVYPMPISTTFIQSRVDTEPHHILFTGDEGMVARGSLMATVQHKSPLDEIVNTEGKAASEGLTVNLAIPYQGQFGNYSWTGHLYADESATNRPLSFAIPTQTYSVVDEVDYEKVHKMQQEAEDLKRKEQELILLAQQREQERKMMFIYIAVGNVAMIILGLAGWLIRKKIQAKKALQPEMQLKMPKE